MTFPQLNDEQLDLFAHGLGIDSEEAVVDKRDFISRARIWLAGQQVEEGSRASVARLMAQIRKRREESKTDLAPVISTAAAASGDADADQHVAAAVRSSGAQLEPTRPLCYAARLLLASALRLCAALPLTLL